MPEFSVNRRGLIAAAATAPMIAAAAGGAAQAQVPGGYVGGGYGTGGAPTSDQQRRLAWWHQAKFGMFIHFGLYAAYGRHEWAMETQAVPIADYQKLTAGFLPVKGSARKWAQLAKAVGMNTWC